MCMSQMGLTRIVHVNKRHEMIFVAALNLGSELAFQSGSGARSRRRIGVVSTLGGAFGCVPECSGKGTTQ